MINQPIQVFLDATTLIKVGPPPGNETFSRLVDLVQYGLITVVTTDLTIAEVVRHHSDVACDTLRPLFNPRLLRSASRYLRIQIPDISDRDVRERVQSQISEGVASMFSRLNTTVLKIDEVMPSKIFDDYDQNMGFFVNRNKKNQFPDAFAFERLKSVATPENPVLVVSDDPDFKSPVEAYAAFRLLDSIEALFGELGLLADDQHPSLEPFLRSALTSNTDFLAYVELNDEHHHDYRVSTVCHGINIENMLAFRQLNEYELNILVNARVSVDLEVDLEYHDGTPPELELGRADVAFYASITTDSRRAPTDIAELRVYDCSLEWVGVSIGYVL